MNRIRERIEALLQEMCRGAFEREEIISLALLSALAGESIFLLGLPGVGKSMVARRLKMAFSGSSSFEYLMSRFSTPDEIFGPVSISKLKDADAYERVTEGYLPSADVIFLDEIWKAGPAIQNALLTVLNERIFRNGKQDIRLPLKAVISASNELPAEGEGLEAMWDRFLIRYVVKPIQSKELFMDLIGGQVQECVIPDDLKLTPETLAQVERLRESVELPRYVGEMLFTIRHSLEVERNKQANSVGTDEGDIIVPPYVSDRRWKKAVSVLRTSALLNGRNTVDLTDCLLLTHMLWDNDEQVRMVNKLVCTAVVGTLKKQGIHAFVESIMDNELTQGLGKPLSDDGLHYSFMVGEEEIKIKMEIYENLSLTETTYADITADNELVVGGKASTLSVRKKAGGIVINSFCYPLKTDTTLRSGSVGTLTNKLDTSFDTVVESLKLMVGKNLFLPEYDKMDYLLDAIDANKNKFTAR